MRSQSISTCACGETSKIVISLNLDLYEKVYTLVHCNTYLREWFILCLGELHAVFAHIRAIGNYITCSGLDNAWMCAEWIDSPCLLGQVIECLNTKRAIVALEPTIIAISTLLLKEMMIDFNDELCTTGDSFLKFIDELRTAIFGGRCKVDTSTFAHMEEVLHSIQSLDFDNKLQHVISKSKGNKVFHYLMSFMRIVGRLFTFIEAPRTRNWFLHLSAAEELMKDFASLDRIKYRRWWAIYIADILQSSSDPEDKKVWDAFMAGDFSCQKTDIPGTAIGRDHAGEQENCNI